MKNKIILSTIAATALVSYAQDLGTIEVKEDINTKVVDQINTKEVKNADLAEALAKKSPSVTLIRRSGIANDIILRGQKRDNIKVTIDDTVVHGACPNRMDPPTSHVITNMVESVEITEGPFDVTEFGSLSGGVKVNTIKPTKELSGEIGATIGSYGYKKGSVTVSGGNDLVQALISYSKEQSDQYKDGDGNTLAEQTAKAQDPSQYGGMNDVRYSDKYDDMKAYEKESLMAKVNLNIADNQEIALSATKNESDNILYPSSGMDALYDDSDLYSLQYTAKNLGDFSKKLDIKVYKTEVDHPMSIDYRVKNDFFKNGNAMQQRMAGMTNHLTTNTRGLKLQNSFDAIGRNFNIGIDTSKRNWDGNYYSDLQDHIGKSIDDTDTTNKAIFLECTNPITDNAKIQVGVRYDSTDIETAGNNDDQDYNGLSGNIRGTYNINNTTLFAGVGQAYRVPDARELYFNSFRNNTLISTGNEDLDQTRNREIDLGIEQKYTSGSIKVKTFYSKLKNYIYFNNDRASLNDAFENIDATIYGVELSGAYYLNDQFTLDAGYTYKRGKKDKALDGQTDTDLADITPAKLTIGLTYDYNDHTYAMVEFAHVSSWNNFDSDNGEQAIAAHNVVNIKAQTTIANNFEITAGIDNLFDETYAVSNTYRDLTLLSDITTDEVMLLNEPGRYAYISLKYKF